MKGELDRAKISRETGASINTVYNVISDLAGYGYVLATHEKKKKASLPPPLPPLYLTGNRHQH